MADILIVDDDADLAAALSELLEAEGHRTEVALDGAAGLAALSRHLPDLILLDIEMPVLDGPGMAYAAIAENAGREQIPIVLSSGYPDLDAIADALGTEYRAPKPCSLEFFSSLVRRALDERKAPRPRPLATAVQ